MNQAAGIKESALPLQDEADLDPLMDRIGDARYVLIGEASHGTHEYYAWRAALSRRLIRERGFSFVGVEGDWPDCYAVDRSVKHLPGAPEDPEEVLHGFERWPTWMWANREVAAFTRWLREFNGSRPVEERVGFYGLDVYSLWDSLRETLGYLKKYHPGHVETALEAFRCFEPFVEDPQSYALSTRLVPSGCEAEVVELLGKVRASAAIDDVPPRDERFNAEQNALSAAGAESYYRAMVGGGSESWNVRDHHMVATLERLMDHHGGDAKAIVWEHNTHIGDARWTDMSRAAWSMLANWSASATATRAWRSWVSADTGAALLPLTSGAAKPRPWSCHLRGRTAPKNRCIPHWRERRRPSLSLTARHPSGRTRRRVTGLSASSITPARKGGEITFPRSWAAGTTPLCFSTRPGLWSPCTVSMRTPRNSRPGPAENERQAPAELLRLLRRLL